MFALFAVLFWFLGMFIIFTIKMAILVIAAVFYVMIVLPFKIIAGILDRA